MHVCIMYVCMCVCMYVYIYIHTHTHKLKEIGVSFAYRKAGELGISTVQQVVDTGSLPGHACVTRAGYTFMRHTHGTSVHEKHMCYERGAQIRVCMYQARGNKAQRSRCKYVMYVCILTYIRTQTSRKMQ